MRRAIRLVAPAILAALVAASSPSAAQAPPSPAELSAYQGLHAAAAAGDVDGVRSLARAGADLNATDAAGRTPLHVAAFAGRPEAVRALLAAGADPSRLEAGRYDAVTIAAVRDDGPTLRALLDGGARADLVTSRYDGTALIAAAHLGHAEAVRMLIGAGAPLDHVNNLGWTALMEAVVLGDGGPRHVETARALVEAGADASIPDRAGVAPLAHARTRGFAAVAAALEASRPR